MFLSSRRRAKGQKGQAILLFVVAMGLVLFGALGLAIDGSQLFAHRQMAQAAADAAAQAAIMSIFNKTNTGSNAFGGSTFTCGLTDPLTPCYYARKNGVGSTADDVVLVEFPTSAPGVSLSPSDTPNLVRVTVTRTVHNGIVRFVAPALSTIRASGTAAIVDVVAPTPILVLHPTKTGSFALNGNPTIQICGGPRRSIQVNTSALTSVFSGGPVVDLSHAGPLDTAGNCTTGTGGDFGSYGLPATRPAQILVGAAQYIQPASPILDPLIGVPAPAVPAVAPAKTPIAFGVGNCPPALPGDKNCFLYSPGLYTGDELNVKNEQAFFKPGVYYVRHSTSGPSRGGFKGLAGSTLRMATGFADDPITGQGMLVYVTGNTLDDVFDVGANGSASLLGTPQDSIYKGILFFSDHTNPVVKVHKIGGGGNLTLTGTIYLANRLANTTATAYQHLLLRGTPGSATTLRGQIVVDVLEVGGNAGITMNLQPNTTLHIRQVALVN